MMHSVAGSFVAFTRPRCVCAKKQSQRPRGRMGPCVITSSTEGVERPNVRKLATMARLSVSEEEVCFAWKSCMLHTMKEIFTFWEPYRHQEVSELVSTPPCWLKCSTLISALFLQFRRFIKVRYWKKKSDWRNFASLSMIWGAKNPVWFHTDHCTVLRFLSNEGKGHAFSLENSDEIDIPDEGLSNCMSWAAAVVRR